ncbi:MAG: YdcF family protein [Thermoplasmata archaeon]
MKAIIVLGCMLKSCEPTYEMKGRVERAVQFSNLIHPDLMIFSGGHTSPECPYSEAGMMQKLALEMGEDKNITRVEGKSTTTVENAVYVRALLDKELFSGDLYIVTSCYHMIRSITIFRTVIPNLISLSGLCFECKPERLESEASRLIIDQNIMSRVSWNGKAWLESYEKLDKTVF